MEGQVILTTPKELKLLLVEAVSIALKYHQPAAVTSPANTGSKVDFSGLRREYYPGIPESTVRQDTAHLSRTKVGKRILFDRTEIEEHLHAKRRTSTSETDLQADDQFTRQHQRTGGRKAA
ncbi:hypothetical protein [Spirosoma validum]|uniref:Uncharacterized protein n=1 Tax=Spirosoma validum TaxID=2771355 RepID=A0A927AZF9_9BACT|nr:hypothetical protein [Spirosoma validum]MBD2752609.1 hypothetical protein [Spirosoma validum]